MTSGFNWEGFFRAFQGNLTSFVGFLILILVLWFIINLVTGRLQKAGDIGAKAATIGRRWTSGVAMIALLVLAIITCWQAATMASINRMPRADVDKSGVYEAMKDNLRK